MPKLQTWLGNDLRTIRMCYVLLVFVFNLFDYLLATVCIDALLRMFRVAFSSFFVNSRFSFA